ncbi:MAG: hypothetical protein ACXW6K_23815 [Candidatus Binatia bacterium]
MKLRDLPDWSKRFGSLDQSDRAVLKSAEASTLGHFAALVIESKGVQSLTLLEVGAGKINKVLAVLKAHIGRPLDEIAQLELIE